MDEVAPEPSEEPPEVAPRTRRGRRRRVLGVLLGVSVLGLGGLWLARERLADRVISGQLESYGLPATYKIASVGPTRQVLTDVVIGDPAHPDLTVERAEIELVATLGVPTVGKVVLIRPRLYGSYKAGHFSLGSLDKLLSGGGGGGIPDLNLVLDDGRARIATDYGALGIKAAGNGNLRDGFAGILAAVAPALETGSCKAERTTLFGTIRTSAGEPRFAGPLRIAALTCAGPGLVVRDAGMQIDATLGAALDSVSGKAGLTTGAVRWQGESAARLTGSSSFTMRGGDLTGTYRLAGQGVDGALSAASLAVDGMLRTRDRFARIESEGMLAGQDLRPGAALDTALAGAVRASADTLGAPLLDQLRRGLHREGRGSRLAAGFTLRQTGEIASLVVPRAVLRGGSGADVLSISRLQLAAGGKAGIRASGNLVTAGAGMPRLSGRVERSPGGMITARLAMPEYRAGDARLAFPSVVVVNTPRGEIGFTGTARLSGALPGGRAEGLVIPLDGIWSARRGLAMGRRCLPLAFQSLSVANLTLDRRSLTLCPGRDGAIVRSDARGLRVAAGASSLAVTGRLGDTPIRIASGPLGFAWPGTLAAQSLAVELGAPAHPSRFQITSLTARINGGVAGRFDGTEVRLDAVPLDILAATGNWTYAGGKFAISGAAFQLEDRQKDDRFRPLIARDATLTLENGRIAAGAVLREPKSDREITRADIAHELASGRGFADLAVPGVRFDDQLQPDTLTYLALGVIANARGEARGTGRIDWTPERVSSTGSFTTDGLDFAAAFGPVKGVAGTVVFTDLLGLVTAPDQRLKIAEINPGIPVDNGELSFALQGNGVLMINGAHWPFLDGTLDLLPTRMVLGAAEVRRYTLHVVGLNAARFVERMELTNLAASGTFDGDLPLVFDENGGRIEGGMLIARAPGGNVSYVGELTYKDLSPMANFAFQTLRSLDYRKMSIGMDGALDGEIVTRVRFDGVRQGDKAKKNFITSRFANLPIQFNVNIRAPFQKLIGSFKSLYDPSFIRDPRTLGLVDHAGRPVGGVSLKSPAIQPPVSRTKP